MLTRVRRTYEQHPLTCAAVGVWLLGLAVCLLLDRSIAREVWAQRVHVQNSDWSKLVRSLGFLPFWFITAAVVLLTRRSRAGRTTKQAWDAALAIIAAPVLAGLASELLKILIRRERMLEELDFATTFRPIWERTFSSSGLSLPSGHTALAFAGATILARLFPATSGIWFLAAAGTAMYRVNSAAHFLSDVYVGATLGLAAGWFVCHFNRRYGGASMAPAEQPATRLPPPPPPFFEDVAKVPEAPGEPCVLSLVVPAYNEQANVPRLVQEVQAALWPDALSPDRLAFELIVVDDGSTDGTSEALRALAATRPWLRPVRLTQRRGQSAAMWVGIRAASGAYVATLDADLQNDPADLPRMLEIAQRQGFDLVQGYRANRKDTKVKRITSKIGRGARNVLLRDPIRDTGCSTRVMRAEVARLLPLQYHGMHRFVPVMARTLGASIVETPVNHRPREAGVSKYGIRNRAIPGLLDCLAMRWMIERLRITPLARPVATPSPQAPQPHTVEAP